MIKKPVVAPKRISAPFAASKSGDSKLQDAEAATIKSQENPVISDLPEVLQAAAEEKKAAGLDPTSTLKALDMLTKALEGLETRLKKMETRDPITASESKTIINPLTLPRCGICEQYLKNPRTGRGVCNGTHKMARVVPSDTDLWVNFPGIMRNGINYAGTVQVPEEMHQDILTSVRRWEVGQKRLFMPGGKVFGDMDVRSAGLGRTPIIDGDVRSLTPRYG